MIDIVYWKWYHVRSAHLNKTKKKKDMSAGEYFTKMKGLCSELASAGKPIDDDELIGYILNGLDGSYNDVVAAVNRQHGTTLDDLFAQIASHST